MTVRTQYPVSPIFLGIGFLLWLSALSVLYAALSVGCELGWHRTQWGPFNLLRWILFALWAGHMVSLAWLYRVCRRRLAAHESGHPATSRFLGRASVAVTAAAIASTLWIGLAIPASSMCV